MHTFSTSMRLFQEVWWKIATRFESTTWFSSGWIPCGLFIPWYLSLGARFSYAKHNGERLSQFMLYLKWSFEVFGEDITDRWWLARKSFHQMFGIAFKNVNLSQPSHMGRGLHTLWNNSEVAWNSIILTWRICQIFLAYKVTTNNLSSQNRTLLKGAKVENLGNLCTLLTGAARRGNETMLAEETFGNSWRGGLWFLPVL